MPLTTRGQIPTTFRFTKSALQDAIAAIVASGKKQVELCDTELPNFRLIVYGATGKASYTSRVRIGKRRDSQKLGDFRILTLEQARAMHRELIVDIARGVNPKQRRMARMTFAEFSVVFLELSKGKKKSHADDVQKFEKRLNPTFGKHQLAEIMPHALNKFLNSLHTKEGLAKATVNRYGTLLRTFFNRAIECGALPSGKNPMTPIKAFTEDNAPTDFMSVEDMKAFLAAANEETNRQAAILLMLLLLTGARLSEFLLGRWSQVDLPSRQWRLAAGDSKNGRAGIIPLPTTAIPLIEELAKTRRNELVFPGQRGNLGAMSRPGKTFDRILERAGLTGRGFTIHSLRHAFASGLANAGVPLWSIQMILRQRSAQMVQRYSHAQGDILLAASEQLSALVCNRL